MPSKHASLHYASVTGTASAKRAAQASCIHSSTTRILSAAKATCCHPAHAPHMTWSSCMHSASCSAGSACIQTNPPRTRPRQNRHAVKYSKISDANKFPGLTCNGCQAQTTSCVALSSAARLTRAGASGKGVAGKADPSSARHTAATAAKSAVNTVRCAAALAAAAAAAGAVIHLQRQLLEGAAGWVVVQSPHGACAAVEGDIVEACKHTCRCKHTIESCSFHGACMPNQQCCKTLVSLRHIALHLPEPCNCQNSHGTRGAWVRQTSHPANFTSGMHTVSVLCIPTCYRQTALLVGVDKELLLPPHVDGGVLLQLATSASMLGHKRPACSHMPGTHCWLVA